MLFYWKEEIARAQGRYKEGIEWDKDVWCEIHKESVKKYKIKENSYI